MSFATFVLTTTASVFAVLSVSRFLLEWYSSKRALLPAMKRADLVDPTFVSEVDDELSRNAVLEQNDDWSETSNSRRPSQAARPGQKGNWSF